MSEYWEIEQSTELGNPVELYKFQAQGQSWRYTSADEDVCMAYVSGEVVSGEITSGELIDNLYEAVPIRRGELEQTNDISKSDLRVTAARDNPLAKKFILDTPETVTSLTIFRCHVQESSVELDDYESLYSGEAPGKPLYFKATEPFVVWKGRVVSVTFSNDEAEFNCESVYTSLKRYGLLSKFQYICRHALYSQGNGRCNVSGELFRDSGHILSVDGLNVEVDVADSHDDGWYVGGFMKVGDYSYRYIKGHSGKMLQVNKVFSDSVVSGEAVDIYAGCDHSLDTCREKFDNLENFGGFPHIPLDNPFSNIGNTLL